MRFEFVHQIHYQQDLKGKKDEIGLEMRIKENDYGERIQRDENTAKDEIISGERLLWQG